MHRVKFVNESSDADIAARAREAATELANLRVHPAPVTVIVRDTFGYRFEFARTWPVYSGFIRGRKVIELFAGKFTDEIIARHAAKPAFCMPVARVTDIVRYTLFHEWGHVVDPMTETGKDDQHYDPYFWPDMSVYGNSGGGEAYAETFAEWHLTYGRTNNLSACAAARIHDWMYA